MEKKIGEIKALNISAVKQVIFTQKNRLNYCLIEFIFLISQMLFIIKLNID